MKKHILIASLAIAFFTGSSQPVVYFDFVTHDEDQGPWNNPSYYIADRNKLIALATYFQTNGITMNMQSDWLYLTNVISKEPALISPTTNNKSILRWMHEDMGVEMDPHSHENTYIYPDIVKLMDSIGLPESKLIGGSLYNAMNGINLWTNLSNGQNGVIFPNKFWQPDYLMGGGSPMHVADLNYYGFWNPQDTANYLVHNTAQHIRHIGTGCEIKIHDTSTVAEVIAKLNQVIQNVQSGQYPANGFYLQTIFFGHGDLNSTAFYDTLIAVANAANAIVATGAAQWKTLKQVYTLWETAYNAQMFQWECGAISSGLEESSGEPSVMLVPNPANDVLNLVSANDPIRQVRIRNMLGEEVMNLCTGNQLDVTFGITGLNPGMYFVTVNERHTQKLQVIH